jgi:predicted DNA-binding protein
MDITINIGHEMKERLEQRAMDCGQDVTEYLEKLIEKDLSAPISLRALYAPVREQIRKSGISDEELDVLLDEARDEAFRERQTKSQ